MYVLAAEGKAEKSALGDHTKSGYVQRARFYAVSDEGQLRYAQNVAQYLLFLAEATGMATPSACQLAGQKLGRYAAYSELVSDTRHAERKTNRMLIGVDFGNTVIKAGIVDQGRVLRSMVADTPSDAGPPEILDTIARLVRALGPQPDAVGIAIPGEVNTDGRCWRLPNTRGFEGVRIAEEVSRRLHCPIAVENRATAAALAERLYGHGQQQQTFMLVSLETGVGGGLVIGRQLYPGANGFGAEIGHICVDTSPDAPLCGCGQRGCVEAFAGTRAVLRKFVELGGKATELGAVAASARRAEWIGVMAFETMGRALGRALGTIQNFLDLGAVVFAGSAAAHFDLLEPFVREELRRKAFAPPLAEVRLLVSDLGENAGVIGAAHLTTL